MNYSMRASQREKEPIKLDPKSVMTLVRASVEEALSELVDLGVEYVETAKPMDAEKDCVEKKRLSTSEITRYAIVPNVIFEEEKEILVSLEFIIFALIFDHYLDHPDFKHNELRRIADFILGKSDKPDISKGAETLMRAKTAFEEYKAKYIPVESLIGEMWRKYFDRMIELMVKERCKEAYTDIESYLDQNSDSVGVGLVICSAITQMGVDLDPHEIENIEECVRALNRFFRLVNDKYTEQTERIQGVNKFNAYEWIQEKFADDKTIADAKYEELIDREKANCISSIDELETKKIRTAAKKLIDIVVSIYKNGGFRATTPTSTEILT
jgi:hypothetical protein